MRWCGLPVYPIHGLVIKRRQRHGLFAKVGFVTAHGGASQQQGKKQMFCFHMFVLMVANLLAVLPAGQKPDRGPAHRGADPTGAMNNQTPAPALSQSGSIANLSQAPVGAPFQNARGILFSNDFGCLPFDKTKMPSPRLIGLDDG